jgi:hypothetical protein
MKIHTAACVLTGWLIASACEARPPVAESPEARYQRVSAFRQACVAHHLALQSEDDMETLAAILDGGDPTDDTDFSRGITLATYEFARAFHQHAELRYRAYAYLDSAVNHSATPPDSARYIEYAATFTIRLPAEGTVEANVLNRYQADLAQTLADADHRCNWDIPY